MKEYNFALFLIIGLLHSFSLLIRNLILILNLLTTYYRQQTR